MLELLEERFVVGKKVGDARQDEEVSGPLMQFTHAAEVYVEIHQDTRDGGQDERDEENGVDDCPRMVGQMEHIRMVWMLFHVNWTIIPHKSVTFSI